MMRAKLGAGSRWLLIALIAGLAARTNAGPGSVVNPADNLSYPTYYANSPPLAKFVDPLPLPGAGIPLAVPDTGAYPGSDYYEISIVEYEQQMHSGLPNTTKLRGYKQTNGANPPASYLGPVIVAQRDRPVRLKVTNELPVGVPFFIPVDATVMGAGKGPVMGDGVTPCDPLDPAQEPLCAPYSENRAGVHLHGGLTPWISDGLPHQWLTPAGETSPLKVGVGARNVPDMTAAGDTTYLPKGGSMTLYYPNQQSGRLMFYHDHAYGMTRLNVYGGVAAGYLLVDPVERALTNGSREAEGLTAMPDVPLVIQDKTFVADNITTQDARWPIASKTGDLWFPHIYEENQDPTCAWDIDCMNPLGRWDYGPWIWPPVMLPTGKPNPSAGLDKSLVPEAFMDVMVVNGRAYPTMPVEPKAYRLRILNASNDRFLNLQLYYAISKTDAALDPTRAAYFDRVTGTACIGGALAPTDCTEVAMVPRNGDTYTTPWGDQSTVPFDGRMGGVPDPRNAGPAILQIGSEGGLLPKATMKNAPPIPITYDTDPKSMTVGNVSDGTFILGPAERADAVVDFSQVPPGSTLILYNDAPAAFPAGDQRYDYYTFGPDFTDTGGYASPAPGVGPNTRTVMQFVVGSGPPAPAYAFASLAAAIPAAYAQSQEQPLVPEPDYPGYPASAPKLGQYAKVFNTTSFTYVDDTGSHTLPIHQKAIAEEFDPAWGRMSAVLGTEAMITGNQGQNTFGFMYVDPATEVLPQGEVQIWKITHNGVDTHAIHFHLINVQVINRVDWAGVVKKPDPNEVGWKETVRMNPLEDIILAVKAVPPKLPFTVPESSRVRDVTRPVGLMTMANQMPFTDPWPYLQPQGTTPAPDPGSMTMNDVTNYGWEYVWHCHLLGHEENDMMRPLIMTNVTGYNTADVYPPTITAAPASGSINPSQAITLTASDVSGQRTYLDTGIASFSYTLNGGTAVPGTGLTATITPPSGGWTVGSNVTIVATATDQAATPNTTTSTFTYTVAFPAPALTNATLVQATRVVTVTWTYPAGIGQTGFALERAPVVNGVVGTFAQVATFGPGATSGTNTLPAMPGTQGTSNVYAFRVVALLNALSSAPSGAAQVTQLPALPAAPTNLSVTRTNNTTLTIAWRDRSGNELGFTLVRERQTPTGWVLDATITRPPAAGPALPTQFNNLSYVDSGLPRKTTYRYTLSAFNDAGSVPGTNNPQTQSTN